MADLLVGVVSGPRSTFITTQHPSIWLTFIIETLSRLFPVASLVNLSFISLERLHSTLYPFRHCLLDRCVYLKIICGSWILSFLIAAMTAIFNSDLTKVCYTSFTLIVIKVSYVIIAVKVKSNPPAQPFGSVVVERNLSLTLFIVTVCSILTMLPAVIMQALEKSVWSEMSSALNIRLHIMEAVFTLFYANSIVNPLVYAIRMQAFRKAVKELICKKTTQTRRVQPIELHAT